MGLKFVGVSTGRAGSVWISKVFNQSGITCLHEHVFNANQFPPEWNQPDRVLGEWSAQAVPFLPLDCVVFHQVRHPLKVITSYLARGTFGPGAAGVEGRFIIESSGVTGTPIEQACQFYLRWNRMIEPYADLRWRVEDVTDTLIRQCAAMVGADTSPRISKALSNPPANAGPKVPTITWDQIPNHYRTELRAMAEEYGY